MDIGDGNSARPDTIGRRAGASETSWWPGRSRRLLVLLVGVASGVVIAFWAIQFLDDRDRPAIVIEDAAADATVVVSVEGRVSTPGVFELGPGARVGDALDAAGGVLPDADLAAINRAARIQDGERIIVPALGDAGAPPASATSTSVTGTSEAAGLVASGSPININTASATELESLPGIGPAKAEAIVEYRDSNGPFQSVDDLADVPGVSPEMVDELRPLVRV